MELIKPSPFHFVASLLSRESLSFVIVKPASEALQGSSVLTVVLLAFLGSIGFTIPSIVVLSLK